MVLPSGQVILPVWEQQGDGLKTRFDSALEVNVKAGDYITLRTDDEIDGNRYINVYYLFEADNSTLDTRPIPLELVYSDYNVEIYRVN